jgi:pyruvate formate lyase activating enzyme
MLHSSLAKIKEWRSILDIAKRAKEKWNMHVEVVTNVIPTLNDDDEQLEHLAKWIKEDLGDKTPWHVTRFYPQYQLQDIQATPIATLEKAYDIGKRNGLKFVYLGNVPGHDGENTICYQCGKTVIRRIGYNTEVIGVNGSKCAFCGADLNIRTSLK